MKFTKKMLLALMGLVVASAANAAVFKVVNKGRYTIYVSPQSKNRMDRLNGENVFRAIAPGESRQFDTGGGAGGQVTGMQWREMDDMLSKPEAGYVCYRSYNYDFPKAVDPVDLGGHFDIMNGGSYLYYFGTVKIGEVTGTAQYLTSTSTAPGASR